MEFEERARDAGRTARQIGSAADRPDLLAEVARRRRRRLATWGPVALAAVIVFVLAAPLGSGEGTEVAADTTTTAAPTTTLSPTTTLPPSTTTSIRGECLVTLPTETFLPTEEYPETPPELFDSVWVGTSELWTMVPNEGASWEDLPENTPGLFTQKVFWWTEGYLALTHPVPPLVVTAINLHNGDLHVFEGPDVTGGFNSDIGNFMIAGVDLPAGCWELTGTLDETSVSLVVEIIAG